MTYYRRSFGTAFSPAISTIVDWAFNPIDNQLYAVNSSGIVIRINPITGAVTPLTTNGIPAGLYGAAFFDSAGFFYAINNATGRIYRITLSGLTATGIIFSQSVASGNNDGARCPLAPISLLTATKSVDKVTATIGEILTYTLIVTNISTTVTAMNAILTDPIPVGTNFVSGSVTVNGVPNVGDPSIGILLGNIAPQTSLTITFQVQIDNSPPNAITNIGTVSADDSEATPSNEVTTQIISLPIATLTSVKTVNHATANIGDVLTYTVVVTNTGNVTADHTVFTDPIPNGMTFVPNSVTVNGLPTPGVNPATGFTLGPIAPSTSVTVSFQVTVTSIPVPNPASNISTTSFDYIVDPNLPPVPGTSTSNSVLVQINIAIINIVKAVDKIIATTGDILMYTLTLTNKGNVPALNVQLTDQIPVGATFVDHSVTIDGIPQPSTNPNYIIFITSIAPSKSVTIQFKVILNQISITGVLENIAKVSFSYIVDPNLPPVFVNNILSNTITTVIPPEVTINLCPITCHFDKNFPDFFTQHSNFYCGYILC
ncbi:DUF6923 family protein [Bacillus cereus]